MKERPINLKAHEVRGILDGTCLQLRRPVGGVTIKGRGMIVGLTGPDTPDIRLDIESGEWYCEGGLWHKRCPFGRVNDRLWVKESWKVKARHFTRDSVTYLIDYRADPGSPELTPVHHQDARKYMRDSYHSGALMPRWASRLLLSIEHVAVSRMYGQWEWLIDVRQVQP